jgi:hypothetical protein
LNSNSDSRLEISFSTSYRTTVSAKTLCSCCSEA